MPEEISLKPTVAELDKAVKKLEQAKDKATGELKKNLELKLTEIAKVREELIVACGKTFSLLPIKR